MFSFSCSRVALYILLSPFFFVWSYLKTSLKIKSLNFLVTIGNPFKHYKRATEKTVFSYVRVGVTVKTLKYVEKEKIKIPYTVNFNNI